MLDQGILEVRYTKRTVTDTLLRANDYREERIFKNWPLGKVTVFNHFGLNYGPKF